MAKSTVFLRKTAAASCQHTACQDITTVKGFLCSWGILLKCNFIFFSMTQGGTY